VPPIIEKRLCVLGTVITTLCHHQYFGLHSQYYFFTSVRGRPLGTLPVCVVTCTCIFLLGDVIVYFFMTLNIIHTSASGYDCFMKRRHTIDSNYECRVNNYSAFVRCPEGAVMLCYTFAFTGPTVHVACNYDCIHWIESI